MEQVQNLTVLLLRTYDCILEIVEYSESMHTTYNQLDHDEIQMQYYRSIARFPRGSPYPLGLCHNTLIAVQALSQKMAADRRRNLASHSQSARLNYIGPERSTGIRRKPRLAAFPFLDHPAPTGIGHPLCCHLGQ